MLTTGLRQAAFLWLALGVLASTPAWALDDPDAPERVAEFAQRAQSFEDALGEKAGSGAETAALADYERFLEAELNQAYAMLSGKLNATPRRALLKSQRAWLRFRDAEFAFIGDHWTPARFGTSARLSRGLYRSTVTKDRILSLLNYLRNYP